jgi:hypothetical protein
VSLLALSVYVVAGASTAHAYVLKTTKTGHSVHWATPVISLSVDEQLVQHFGKDEVHDALTIATEAWRGLPRVPDVVINGRAAPGYQADARTNGVYLMMPWPFAREQLAVTVSTYDLDGHMIGADILVNGESDYALLPDSDDMAGMTHHDLAAVLTHEVGHVLGLDESPDDQSATMWPYIRGGDVHQRTISQDDEAGVIAAYKNVALDADTSVGCAQANVLGARPDASTTRLALWVAGILYVVHRVTQRRGARVTAEVRVASVLQKLSVTTTREAFVDVHVHARASQRPQVVSACRS